MNYRHAYHAGNFADVLKHATLALIIEHLKAKPTPFRVIDTHAGRGLYDLQSVEAGKTGEWSDGIGRLLAEPLPPAVEHLFAPYLSAVDACNGGADAKRLVRYPGSPAIVHHLMRDCDKLVASELHPIESIALSQHFAQDRRVKVLELDGWVVLKANLPPPERRGVIVVDPPFEEPGEFHRMVLALDDARRRFETGIMMMWYPIKDDREVGRFRQDIAMPGKYERILDVELMVKSPDGHGLPGCGLVIKNPPFELDLKLSKIAGFLAERLGRCRGAASSVSWLAPERARSS